MPPLSKSQAPANIEAKKDTTDQSTTDGQQKDPTLVSEANPEGKANVSTGPVGATEVIDAQEHVLGDDPRRTAHKSGYHDSMSGAPVTADGEFVEVSRKDTGPIPKHRIVADNWPGEREKIDDSAKREGNEAV